VTGRPDGGAGAADWLAAPDLAPVVAGDALEPLYAGAAVGRLVLPFCAACGLALELEQRVCDGCESSGVTWRDVPLGARVHAVTTVHRREPGLIRATAPYHVLDVEVASGHRVVMTTVTPTACAPAIGQPVSVGFRTVSGPGGPGGPGGVAVPAAHVGPADAARPPQTHPPEREVNP
jgi:uncharacterized OB-fold protein